MAPSTAARNIALVLAFAGCSGQVGSGEPGGPRGEPTGRGPASSRPGASTAPGGSGGAAALPAGSCAPLPARVWKLTPTQLAGTFEALVPGTGGLAKDLRRTLVRDDEQFVNEAGVQDLNGAHFEGLLTATEAVAAKALATPAALDPCLAATPLARDCALAVIRGFGARAFRRPLEASEVDRYVAFYDRHAASGPPALASALQALLMSPETLFRTELGAPGDPSPIVKLTPPERASALSYLLLEGPPDAELLAAAEAGGLETKEQIQAQARRLLRSPAGAAGLVRFLEENLRSEAILSADKDRTLFPEWAPELAADLLEETRRFVGEVLFKGDGRYETLMTADFSVVNGRLAPLYGVKGLAPDAPFQRVSLPAGQRSGLLTQGSLLGALAHFEEADVVSRGVFVRERLLCHELPDPPPSVNAAIPPIDGVRTQKERLQQLHSTDPSCAACHDLIDPPGWALENYDALGRYRTHDLGKPVDTSGTLLEVGGPGGTPFTNALGLGRILAEAPEARGCFARRLVQYASGEEALTHDACWSAKAAAALEAARGDVLEAVVALVGAEEFFLRSR